MEQPLRLLKALILCLFFIVVIAHQLSAQTKGMIVKPALNAGRSVLDPNGDGYVSSPATPAGFKFNDVQESEIPYRALPLPAGEVLGDLLRGPTDGFSDFSFLYGNVDPVYTYLSNGNLMFRFRLGGIAPNAKGYSILIDTDNKFGNIGPNADPDYTAANPGFEVEIVLATGFGVRLYNVNGGASPTVGSHLVNLSYDQYAQKAIAYTTNGGSPDYFYDFYIPFAELTKHFPSFTENTPVRMVPNTIMSAQHSALAGPISDVGGIDDRMYAGNYSVAFINIIQNIVPTALNITPSSPFPPLRTAAPVITGTYTAGTSTDSSPLTVRGTSTEAAGTLITVYLNSTHFGTATVGTGGAWAYTLPVGTSLQTSDKLAASATASGKSVSNLSGEATVFAPVFTCTQSATPTITCWSDKGFTGTVPSGIQPGSIIRIYKYGEPDRPVTGIPDIPVQSSGTWSWSCTYGPNDLKNQSNCNAGPGCVSVSIGNGSYYAILIEEGKCASPRSNDVCVNTNNFATAPTLAQTTITTGTTSLNGTAVADATVSVLINNILAGRSTVTAGSWKVSNLNFRLGDIVNVQAVTPTGCPSARTAVQRTVVGEVTTKPTIIGPIRAGAASISGTSTEPAGTVITLFNGEQAICSSNCPVVDAYGNWTLAGLASSVLASSNIITATATAPGKSASSLSDPVTVIAAAPATPLPPTITGSYLEGATSVSGTGPATDINLYIDGYLLSTITSSSSGSWTVTGLSGTNIEKLLYAGGVLTATSGTIGINESTSSERITVLCSTTIPDKTKQVTAAATAICQNNSAVIRIASSEPGISYMLRNEANTADLSSSVLGTGGDIILTSVPLTNSQKIRVTATRGESPICGAALLDDVADITVNPNPQPFTVTVQNAQVCAGTKAYIMVTSSQLNVDYQIRKKSDNSAVGIPVAGTGGQITLETPVLTANGSLDYYVQATSGIAPTFCGTQMSNEVTLTVSALPATNLEFIGGTTNSDGTVNLVLKNSEPTALYQLRLNGNNFGTSVNGNGGDIVFVSDIVTGDKKTYSVVARNLNSGCSADLEATISLPQTVPLPVELISFRGTNHQNQVLLQWSTASETNNDRFELERSQDGRSFSRIASVKGKGTSSLLNRYSFTDQSPAAGANYYRLRQVDYDGTFEYSRVIAVAVQAIADKLRLKTYPSPVEDVMQVVIALPRAQAVTLTLFDVSGRQMAVKELELEKGNNQLELPVQRLKTGIYLLRVSCNDFESAARILKN